MLGTGSVGDVDHVACEHITHTVGNPVGSIEIDSHRRVLLFLIGEFRADIHLGQGRANSTGISVLLIASPVVAVATIAVVVAVLVAVSPVVAVIVMIAVVVTVFHTLHLGTIAIAISLVLGIDTQRDHQHQQDCNHADNTEISKLLHHFIQPFN